MSGGTKIHPTAIVSPGAELDSGVEVGPWCTVGPNVRIGKGTRLISHVVVDGWTRIGQENVFFPFACIGAIPQDLKYKGERTELLIGDRNSIRECVTLNLGTAQGGGKTVIGSDNLIMAYCHMGHDVQMGSHCVIANAASVAGHVVFEDWAWVGGDCTIIQFVRIGSHSYIGAQSLLERDVPPFCIALGSRPAVAKGANIVGLRRRGFAVENIQKINEALKLWTRSDVLKEQCLLEIDSQYGDCAEVAQMIKFIRSSDIGVVR